MRQPSSSKRSRGGRANGKRPNQNSRTAVFESNGSDNKVKGSAAQVLEKYKAMARDAIAVGDRITAENYLQHAEHYYRLLNPQVSIDERSSGRDHANAGIQRAEPFAVTTNSGTPQTEEPAAADKAGEPDAEEKPGNGAADSSSQPA